MIEHAVQYEVKADHVSTLKSMMATIKDYQHLIPSTAYGAKTEARSAIVARTRLTISAGLILSPQNLEPAEPMTKSLSRSLRSLTTVSPRWGRGRGAMG